MSEKIKVIKKKERKSITDKTDMELIRCCKAMLATIYRKYNLDYRAELAKKPKQSALES